MSKNKKIILILIIIAIIVSILFSGKGGDITPASAGGQPPFKATVVGPGTQTILFDADGYPIIEQ